MLIGNRAKPNLVKFWISFLSNVLYQIKKYQNFDRPHYTGLLAYSIISTLENGFKNLRIRGMRVEGRWKLQTQKYPELPV